MNKEISGPVGIGIAAIVLILIIGVGLFLINRPEPRRSDYDKARTENEVRTTGAKRSLSRPAGANAAE